MDRHDPEMLSKCIDLCTQCHRACQELIRHCLSVGGEHASPDHIGLLIACAQICQTSANTMALGVDVHRFTCRACAEICTACAQDCASMHGADEEMRRCADMCRRCAESCQQMAA